MLVWFGWVFCNFFEFVRVRIYFCVKYSYVIVNDWKVFYVFGLINIFVFSQFFIVYLNLTIGESKGIRVFKEYVYCCDYIIVMILKKMCFIFLI